MATKQFKIGEYAVGGIIKVDIGNTIKVSALDYYSKNVVSERTFANEQNSYWEIRDYLNELTSSYYEDKIIEYVESKSNLNKQLFR